MKSILNIWRRRATREDGNATVEFVLVVPVFLLLFVSIFELGMATVRLTMLEHALDRAMREVRLGTADTFSRDDIRDTLCDNASMLKDCRDNILLEMVIIDKDTFKLPETRAECIDTRDRTAVPKRAFSNGASSDLMFIRACYVIDPLYPSLGLGAMLKKDPAGNMQLVASSIFAQEPPKE